MKLEEIAHTHNVKVEKVKDLVGASTHYKKSRKPTLHNAILHAKAIEVNQGKWPHVYLMVCAYNIAYSRSSSWSEGQDVRAQGIGCR